jgi:DNA polymerase
VSDTLKTRLIDLLEEQAAFGDLPLPAGLDPTLFRDPARLAKALARRSTPAAPLDERGDWSRSLRPESTTVAKPASTTSSPQAPVVAPVLPARPFEPLWTSLDELRTVVSTCTRCALAERRTQTVFGVGSPEADLVIVGEAPGEQEDLQGEPFVGPAGQLLDKMLAAIGFSRQDVFICNTLKCRPPFNRDPSAAELAACRSFLDHQLHFLKPKLLLGLGKVAGQTLLAREATLGSMREREHVFQGVPLRITYHPAALLRNEHWKKPTWTDLQELRKRYDELGGKPGSLPGAGKAG